MGVTQEIWPQHDTFLLFSFAPFYGWCLGTRHFKLDPFPDTVLILYQTMPEITDKIYANSCKALLFNTKPMYNTQLRRY